MVLTEDMLKVLMEFSCSQQQLVDLKEHYREDIDSKRTYDKIVCLKDLVKILIKRDCTSQMDYIVNLLNINVVIGNRDFQNPVPPMINERMNFQAVLPDIPRNPVQLVYQVIAEEIGQKWKNLARELGIPEGKIDEFALYHNLEEIVFGILRYHRQRSTENFWKKELFTALVKARRSDLKDKVQDIFCRHGML